MTKGKRKRRRPIGGSSPERPSGEAILGELETRADEIGHSDPGNAGPIWGAAHKLLLKTAADPIEVAKVVATRDADALGRLVRTLRGLDTASPAVGPNDGGGVESAAVGGPTSGRDLPPETMTKALRAFRKRIKLIRLDHESRLGVGPMTGGIKADFDAILPPQEFPTEVWEALATAGKLRRAGQGFYMLPDADERT